MFNVLKKELSIAWYYVPLRFMAIIEGGFWSFIFIFAGNILLIVINIIFFKSLYLQVNTIGGWTWAQSITLIGVYFFVTNIQWVSYGRGYWRLPKFIEMGDLDRLIVRPVSLQWQMVYGWNTLIFDGLRLLISLVIIVYGLWGQQVNIGLFLLALVCANLLYYAFVTIVMTLNFYTIIYRAQRLIGQIGRLGRYPDAIYSGVAKLIFSIVIPITLMFALPARIAFGNYVISELILLLVMTFIFLTISILFWNYSLKHYTSASG